MCRPVLYDDTLDDQHEEYVGLEVIQKSTILVSSADKENITNNVYVKIWHIRKYESYHFLIHPNEVKNKSKCYRHKVNRLTMRPAYTLKTMGQSIFMEVYIYKIIVVHVGRGFDLYASFTDI